MKKLFILAIVALTLSHTSCGPAAEDRATMHSNAKRIGDSIANLIKTSMDEAAAPGPVAQPINTAAATPTTATPTNTPK